MRRTGHIHERSLGSFEVCYTLGTDPAGKRKIATATVRGSRRGAEPDLRRLLRSLDTGEHVDPNRLSVREWLETWLDVIRQEVAPRTIERYGGIVNNFLTPALGNIQLAKLVPAHIKDAYGRAAASAMAKRGPLAPNPPAHSSHP